MQLEVHTAVRIRRAAALRSAMQMHGPSQFRQSTAALVLSLCMSVASMSLGDEPVSLHPVESWTTEFSGRDVVRRFRIESAKPWSGRVIWLLASGERTIGRGEQFIKVSGDSPGETKIAFRVEKLRDGVELPFRLKVDLVDQKTISASSEVTLWFLQEQPFAQRGDWLRSLNIALFDPTGKTVEVFRQAAIPFSNVRSSSAIKQLEQGVLILGDGISFKDHRGLVEDSLAAASRGLFVISLAPADGDFPLHKIEPTGSCELRFRSVGVIRELDKRLDAIGWPPRGQIIRSGIRLPEKGGLVHIDSTGWPWMQAQFNSGGSFVFCGFSLIESWDATPTPRYLLLRILEKLAAGIKR